MARVQSPWPISRSDRAFHFRISNSCFLGIYEYLNQISLLDLMSRRGVQEVAERQENGDAKASVSLGELKAESAGA